MSIVQQLAIRIR